MTRPRRQSDRYGSTAALAITRRRVDVLPQVLDQGPYLFVRPAPGDRRHLVAAVPDELLERLRLREQRVVRDLRRKVAFALEPVALGARAFPFGTAEVLRRAVEPSFVIGP